MELTKIMGCIKKVFLVGQACRYILQPDPSFLFQHNHKSSAIGHGKIEF